MLELILKGVFFLKFLQTTGPNVEIFKHFREKTWESLDLKKYKNGLEDRKVPISVLRQVDDLDDWIKTY